MENFNLHSSLSPLMSALGYHKANEASWTIRMPEIMLLSTTIQYVNAPSFDINLGIVFNPSSNPVSWKKLRYARARFNITLYNLLAALGEPSQQLDDLFFYQPDNIPVTESRLKNNIPAITDLFKKKVIPYFEKWNDYSWLINNFEKEIVRKQFDTYEDPRTYIQFFKRQATNVSLA
jgi:hypothetical protein